MMERTVVTEAWSLASSRDSVNDNEPCYVISVASRMVGVHAQTLRTYERIGLLAPARSRETYACSLRQTSHGRVGSSRSWRTWASTSRAWRC